MKKLLLISVVLIAVWQLNAQDNGSNNEIKTLMGPESSIGGYGGIDIRYGMLDDRDAIVMGVKGAWVMNHSFAMGLAGYAFVTDFEQEKYSDLQSNLQGGYVGMFFEPIIAPKAAVHFSLPMFFGAGGVAYATSYYNYLTDPWYTENSQDLYVEDWDAFFIFKPGIEMEMNVFRFFRLSVGGYYNMTTELDMIPTGKNALDGWEAGISLKFGKF